MKDFSMELIWAKIQMAAAMIGGWLGYLLGGLDGLMIALIIFMVLDYITGLMCAVIDKKLSSAVGFRGEAPQFFVENSHPAIISREVYDLVQMELQRRGKRGRHTSAKSIFSDRLICGECGATFGSKVWHSTDPYRKVIWRCNRKYSRKDTKCPNRHLNEEKIKDAFVIAVNRLVIQKNEILATYDEILAGLTDTAALDAGLQRLEMEKDGILQRITDLIHENATTKMDQGEYNLRYDVLETQRVALSEKQKRIKEKLSDKLFRKRKLEAFMCELKNAEQLVSFDEQKFIRTVEQITVFPDKLVFVFKDGTEIPVEE